MTPGERCDEILRLIDTVLDPTPLGGPVLGGQHRQGKPALAVIPAPPRTLRTARPRATGQER